MSLRAELLAAAVAQRDRALVELADNPGLSYVARYEWGLLVDKLASGATYRLTRDELPAWHPLRRRGSGGDVLVLHGDEPRRATAA